MKKYLFLAIALLGLVSCTNDDIADGNNPIHGGEVETSYIAINLNAADITRAEGGAYQEGLEAERAVKAAYFFFFDDKGDAFPVTATAGNPATGPELGGSVNWISANLNNVGKEMDNVSDIKDAVLVLSTYEGTYPAQIVAVLNWVPTASEAYDLEDLYAATAIQGTEGGFVMSNAVYSDGTKAVVGTPLTASDIYTSPADALANPITIHVERIAAKITVTANGVKDNRFQIQKKTGDAVSIPLDGNDTEVYVQVTGWELYNDFTESKLLKEIDPTWDEMALGFTWNDKPFYRSYWAESLPLSAITDNAFPTSFGLKLGSAANVTAGTYADDTYTYVGENTNYVVNNTNDCTKVIIKAKLQKKIDDETFEDLKLARWYATYYADLDDLLTAVANTIKYQYYWYDETNKKYVYIAPEDLTVKKVDNWVAFTLSSVAMGKNWFIRNGDTYTAKTKEEINDLLDDIEKALYYDEAETLYYVDIKHLGNGTDNAHKAGDYGVVRNHIYNVVLNSFGGLGSPVYIPGGNLVYPNDPLDTGEYVSAEVRVLSWRLVDQVVDIQPNN